MSANRFRVPGPINARRLSLAGMATVGAAAVAVSLVPSDASAAPATPERVASATAAPAAFSADSPTGTARAPDQGAPDQGAPDKPAAAADGGAKGDGGKADSGGEPAKGTTYEDNLDGWIREALSVMDKHDIPGSYDGIHRNVMRESSGDPNAINTWDINAKNGIPSKGLLQVIDPTFDAYHVKGTEKDLYDPVANIVAACNYAADRYGSMDNVDSAY
ncbi:transglycosylase SLT domain-containing protein [Streptomyces radicis]|nr:transglycosylase SLT domain-containing protein [Streptomyces radicis]